MVLCTCNFYNFIDCSRVVYLYIWVATLPTLGGLAWTQTPKWGVIHFISRPHQVFVLKLSEVGVVVLVHVNLVIYNDTLM